MCRKATTPALGTSSWRLSTWGHCWTSRCDSSASASECGANLTASLLHVPSILFLDEPTIGLDAVSKLAFRDFIRRFNRERGVTVILTTHDMDDIEALCTRMMVIGKGRILSDGTLDALQSRITPERRLIMDLIDLNSDVSDPDATVIGRNGHRESLSFDPNRVSAAELVAPSRPRTRCVTSSSRIRPSRRSSPACTRRTSAKAIPGHSQRQVQDPPPASGGRSGRLRDAALLGPHPRDDLRGVLSFHQHPAANGPRRWRDLHLARPGLLYPAALERGP